MPAPPRLPLVFLLSGACCCDACPGLIVQDDGPGAARLAAIAVASLWPVAAVSNEVEWPPLLVGAGRSVAPDTGLPPGCRTLIATSTDARMRWFCQAGPPGSLQPHPFQYNDTSHCVGAWHPWNDCGWQCTNRHIACAAAPRAPKREQLAVFLPGTGLCPHAYSRLLADFASHGFYTLGLQYTSGIGQQHCEASRAPVGKVSTDLNCTARQRYRTLTGQNYSFGAFEAHTNISQPDSISNRIAKALLALGSPWSRWSVNSSAPDWPNIIIAGHSNGADHAAFASKIFPVSRVLLFAGANDQVGSAPRGQYVTPAPWQFLSGATPAQRVFGFGVCPGGPMCVDWHSGWDALGLPGPWLQAQHSLTSPLTSLRGYHKICANGSLVKRGDSLHMASAADCCVPSFPNATSVPLPLRGKLLWSRLYEHMLTSPIGGSTPAQTSPLETCNCNGSTTARSHVDTSSSYR